MTFLLLALLDAIGKGSRRRLGNFRFKDIVIRDLSKR